MKLLEEPTILLTLLKAALVAGVAFGLPLSDSQTEALLGVAVAVLAIGAVNRQMVSPVKKVERLAGEIGGNAQKLVNQLTGGGNGP
jgi:hypothetical protein